MQPDIMEMPSRFLDIGGAWAIQPPYKHFLRSPVLTVSSRRIEVRGNRGRVLFLTGSPYGLHKGSGVRFNRPGALRKRARVEPPQISRKCMGWTEIPLNFEAHRLLLHDRMKSEGLKI